MVGGSTTDQREPADRSAEREHAADGVVIVSCLERAEVVISNVDRFLGVKLAALAALEIAEKR